MGHRKKKAPRRGSLMYYPRVRARRITGRIRTWPKVTGPPRLLGFAGYKVGTTHVVLIENRPKSPLYGKEVIREVTIVEVPPIFVYGIRAYIKTVKGLKTFTEVLHTSLPKYAERTVSIPKKTDFSENIRKIEENLDKINEIRILALTQPHKSGLRKKTPEVLEIAIGGDNIKAIYEYAKSLLGKEVRAKEFFSEGLLVDVTAVTKGKGFAGVVKRFGVKVLPKWHKHRKGHRVVGAISTGHPTMLFTVPRPGKMGFHQRTEYNKLILKVGENPSEINVAGGYLHYGLVRGDYVVIAGTIPGPPKRLIRFRLAIRAKEKQLQPPKITAISLSSKQGV
jgi:large subunit ribosomal protein L3